MTTSGLDIILISKKVAAEVSILSDERKLILSLDPISRLIILQPQNVKFSPAPR